MGKKWLKIGNSNISAQSKIGPQTRVTMFRMPASYSHGRADFCTEPW